MSPEPLNFLNMGIEIENTEIVTKIKKVFNKTALKKIIYGAAADLRNVIHERSMKGRGIRGGFREYSIKPYYRSRDIRPAAKGGRRKSIKNGAPMKTVFYEGGYKQFAALTKGGTLPNLSASGAMFRDMQASAISGLSALVGFSKETEGNKAFANNEIRPFFGATKKEKKELIKNAGKKFSALLAKEGLVN